MPKCPDCDSELQTEQKTCHVCGLNVEQKPASVETGGSPNLPADFVPPPATANSSVMMECRACGKTFNADYEDEFCPCGSELSASTTASAPSIPAPTSIPPIPTIPPISEPRIPSAPSADAKPKAGTACLVVYSDTKPRQPVRYFPLIKDVLLIGREDAVRGDFPDLDLGKLLDESLSKKVSRRHAEVLRARDTQTFTLRPFPGNTGTQVGKELAVPDQRYPLTDGTPIVLGGVVWMKFEVMK